MAGGWKLSRITSKPMQIRSPSNIVPSVYIAYVNVVDHVKRVVPPFSVHPPASTAIRKLGNKNFRKPGQAARMATLDGLPPDPLALLRSSIANRESPIPTTEADPSTQHASDVSLAEASYLVFNSTSPQEGSHHVAIPLTQATRFISGTGKAQDLRTIYFCWLNKDKAINDFLLETSKLNQELKAAGKYEAVVNLPVNERFDLSTWLEGKVPEDGGSEFIRSLDSNAQTRAEAAAAAKHLVEDVEMPDADSKAEADRLREIYAAERKIGDRNTVLRGSKVQDFSDVRKKYSMLFFAKTKAAQQNGPTPALTTNPALRPPVKAAQPGRRPEPIILLSPSASSLLRMPNIKSFLEDGIYTVPEGGSSTNILHLMRTLPTVSPSKPIRFILVDDPSTFRPDYWERLVAVFTTGQTWQFKNYKWQAPAELFSHALGVYIGWKGDPIPETVKGWGRGVLTVQIDKGAQRWRDREVVEDVWRGIEGRMKAMGWGKEGR